MPPLVSAIGIACIGAVYGYFLFYSYKRQHQPIHTDPLPIRNVLLLLTAVGAGGILGGIYLNLEGVNYIGPYGIGLLLGVTANVILTLLYEDEIKLRKQRR